MYAEIRRKYYLEQFDSNLLKWENNYNVIDILCEATISFLILIAKFVNKITRGKDVPHQVFLEAITCINIVILTF